MNRIEVTGLLAYLDRLGLLAFKPGMEDAWFDVVSHLSADDATTAARRLAAQDLPDGRFVARPGDVIDAVGQIRRERIRAVLDGSLPCPPPEIDPDDVPAYQAWRRSFMRALGDGRTLHDAETVACEAAGIPPVHRPVEVHRAPEFRQIGGT